MAQVSIHNVHKRYDDFHAVKNVSLEIKDTEFMVLVGPSGCGKTTTLRMVAGLESITEGHIKIGDLIVNDLPPMDRDIAMVFQNYALYPHMSVFDNMAFGLKMRKFQKAEIEKRVQEAADILGIRDHLHRKPRQLSGGQRQRVALGRAIVRHPQVFLFDEPLSNLDAKLRVQTRVELKKLHNRLGTTAIYVTHDQVEAMTLGDRVVVMKDGIVQQVGEPSGGQWYTQIHRAGRRRAAAANCASWAARPAGLSHQGQMVTRVSSISSDSPSVGTPARRASASHSAHCSPSPSGPVRSWLPELTATRPAACRSARYFKITTDCASSETAELMSRWSPASTTRSNEGATRTTQSNWGSV
jgi:ABC-type sulfate/molybdate transport systems ATPase subunit